MVKAYQSSVYPLPLYQLDKIFDKKKIEEHQELAGLFSKTHLNNYITGNQQLRIVKLLSPLLMV